MPVVSKNTGLDAQITVPHPGWIDKNKQNDSPPTGM